MPNCPKAEYLLPGSFFSEDQSVELPERSVEAAVAAAPERAFAFKLFDSPIVDFEFDAGRFRVLSIPQNESHTYYLGGEAARSAAGPATGSRFTTTTRSSRSARRPPVGEHPHLGRIQAAAHLSGALALVECAQEALREHNAELAAGLELADYGSCVDAAEFLHSDGTPLAADDAAVAIVGALAGAGMVVRETVRGEWQDPSADLENVNAAYRDERDRAERLEAMLRKLLAASRAADSLSISDLGHLETTEDEAAALLEGVERTHILVPKRALPIASHYAHQHADTLDGRPMPPDQGEADKAGRWAHAFAAAARREHVQWPATDTQEGR